MDAETREIIEKGFKATADVLLQDKKETAELSEKVLSMRADLLGAMGKTAAPLIKDVGINMLQKAKRGSDGSLYDQVFTDEKMFVLGKCDPVPYRLDDASKKVDSQFCVINENGKFCEVMYTNGDRETDCFISEITPQEALDIYGFEIAYMLYKSFEQYLVREDDLVSALSKTIAYIMESDKKSE